MPTVKRTKTKKPAKRPRNAEPTPKAKPTVRVIPQAEPPEVCAVCSNRRGRPMFRVVMRVYLLEDLPIAHYYYELCEPCAKRLAKRDRAHRVTDLPLDGL